LRQGVKAVGPQQALGGRRTGSFGNEPVPAPNPAIARDQTLADGQHLSIIFVGDSDLPQAAVELGWRRDMIAEAAGARGERRIARLGLASLPSPRGVGLTERGIRIVAERCGKRALETRIGLKARHGRAPAVFQRAGQGIMFGSCCG
jgi:hypothetical protein